jgi:hypothetical protein
MSRKHRLIAWIALLAIGLWPLPAAAEGPSPGATPPPQLAVGDVVPAFEAEGVDGVHRSLNYPKGPDTVLMFFLSGCPACHKMLPLWNKAFERRPPRLTIFGVMLDREPPGWFMATPISFSVLRAPGGDFGRVYKLHRVPMTLRVGPGGVVKDVAVGPVDAIRLGEFFQP